MTLDYDEISELLWTRLRHLRGLDIRFDCIVIMGTLSALNLYCRLCRLATQQYTNETSNNCGHQIILIELIIFIVCILMGIAPDEVVEIEICV